MLLAVVGTIGCDRVTKYVAAITLADSPSRSYSGTRLGLGRRESRWLPKRGRRPGTCPASGHLHGCDRRRMLLVLIVVAVRRRLSGWPALGVALFVAGGMSNWIDRVTQGRGRRLSQCWSGSRSHGRLQRRGSCDHGGGGGVRVGRTVATAFCMTMKRTLLAVTALCWCTRTFSPGQNRNPKGPLYVGNLHHEHRRHRPSEPHQPPRRGPA